MHDEIETASSSLFGTPPEDSGSECSSEPWSPVSHYAIEQVRRTSVVPSLRHDWDTSTNGDDPLASKITAQEALWGVIITMGVAGMRDQILVDRDVQCYVLHFFCFWGPVSASINYSSHFNGDDAFHKLLWSCFAVGMAGQVSFLYHDLRGFAASTGFLYLVIVAAYVRVMCNLPRARLFCCFFGFANLVALSIFAVLAAKLKCIVETPLLWAHVFLEPFIWVIFRLLVKGENTTMNIPFNADYICCRFEGLLMMMIVCSVLFPLGLMGKQFSSSDQNAVAIIVAFLYALMLKLSIIDTHTNFKPRDSAKRHAMRRGPVVATAYVIIFPFTLLGIALSGIGFVAVEKATRVSFTKSLMCFGSALTLSSLTIAKALHQPKSFRIQLGKIVFFLGASLNFMLPLLLKKNEMWTLMFIMANMGAILLAQVGLQVIILGAIPEHWRWKTPRLLVDWPQFDSCEISGAHVSSQEHFFTVLLAVCVLRLNEDLRVSHDLELYIQRFMMFYGVLWGGMRYASRFNDEDASHKLLWSLYALGLFLMLAGLTAESRQRFLLFQSSTAGIYVLLSTGFAGRAAIWIPRVRLSSGCAAVVHAICAALFFESCFNGSRTMLFWWLYVSALFVDVLFSGLRAIYRDDWDVPMNVEYIVSRFNGLNMEVLGVAVIVPNAVYPGKYPYPVHAGSGVLLAVVLAALIKLGLFDVEHVSFERHAIRRSKFASIAFLAVSLLTILSICLLGSGISMLIDSFGNHGWQARSSYPKQVSCISSSLLWSSLTFTKLLHLPKAHPCVHHAKVIVQGIGAVASLAPLASCDIQDFEALVMIVASNFTIVMSQAWLNTHGVRLYPATNTTRPRSYSPRGRSYSPRVRSCS